MKNLFLILLCSVLTINATSQNKWSFGIEAFPNMTSFLISNKSNLPEENIERAKDFELPKFCFSGQLYASFNLNSKASFSLGVGYNAVGYKTKKMGVTSTNGNPGNNFAELTYSYNNIQIPLLFQYSIYKGLYVRGGINTLLNVYNSTEFQYVSGEKSGQIDKREFEDPEIKDVCFSGQLSLGVTFFNNEKINLYSQITAESYVTSLIKNEFYGKFPFSTGLVIGAKF